MFTCSNGNIIKNRVQKKKKLEQILSKNYSFLIQTLILLNDEVIILTSKDAFIIRLQVPKASFD